MKKNAVLFLVIFICIGCGASAEKNIIQSGGHPQMAAKSSGEGLAAKSERAKMCRDLCNEKHYPNVKFIRTDGAVEVYKIHIVSISDKTICECRF
ncbi:MAG: hypothetical protein WC459_00125 [Patescibacteria group bacterium]